MPIRNGYIKDQLDEDNFCPMPLLASGYRTKAMGRQENIRKCCLHREPTLWALYLDNAYIVQYVWLAADTQRMQQIK